MEDTFKAMGETASKMKDSRPRILIKEERQDLTAVSDVERGELAISEASL